MKDEYQYALLFALLFASLSWMLPTAYFMTAPNDSMMEIRDVNVEINGTTHTVYVEYYANKKYPEEGIVTLYKATPSDSTSVSLKTWEVGGFVQPGVNTATFEFELDEELEPGQYYYDVRITYRPGYNVQRTARHSSGTIAIADTSNNTTTTTANS